MKLRLNRESLTVYMILVVAIIFGGYLRLRNITVDALWLDEVFSVATSHPDNSFLEVYQRSLVDVHPPFYQLFLWFFYKLFGFGEMVGRYLSVIFGILLIPVAFLLGRQMFNCRVGLIAAWLVAVNFYLITYSQETRSYELLALLTTVSFVTFIKAIGGLDGRHVAIYALSAALLVNTHYFGFLVVTAQALLVLSRWVETSFDKRLLYRFGLAGLFILLSIAPHVSYVYLNFHRQGFWVPPPNNRFFIDLFNLYFGSLPLSVMCAALLMIGSVCLMKAERHREVLRLIIFWLVTCTVIPYVRSLYVQPVLTMRSLIILLPALLIVLAFAISLFKDQWAQVAVGVVVLCFSMTPLYTHERPIFTLENQLKPVSQMRDLVKDVIEQQIREPLYASQFIEFDQYFRLLGSSTTVRSFKQLESDLLSPDRPAVFYFVGTREVQLPGERFMKEYCVDLLKETKKGDSVILEFRSNPPCL
ncbi:glycosyltransferase family 39 protein [Pseudomonas sp. MPR-AND1A]|uniref:glycosyltransferase family 39 protein n=1 Tax=Pseudomonas sp. MPR-AND1A TaxID=2070600 RepID=UPI000C883281|nr:glycosyltransferase family 39 protein [Pseudomonas sp. MPR-AND1A]PNA49213.1 hypothetical protein C1X44_28905 [Pseudomonas sp. MPR-AND1A]